LSWEESIHVSRIKKFIESNLTVSRILSIKKQSYSGFVYDVSVPGTEAFFGGDSPVALHNTGHGGLCTLHADDAPSAVQRLLSEPMNVPESFLPFLDLIFVVRRISVPAQGGGFKAVRRIISVDEIIGAQDFHKSFRWDPKTDGFRMTLEKSVKLDKIARDNGLTVEEALKEIDRRALILKWVQQKGIRNFRELSPILELYVSKPDEVFKTAVNELEAKGISVAEFIEEAPEEKG
jgi:hypothetical protein